MANIYDMADTWNDGATTFTAIKMNVTDTASAADSALMDLQVGGVSKFWIGKANRMLLPSSGSYFNYITSGDRFVSFGYTVLKESGGLPVFRMDSQTQQFTILATQAKLGIGNDVILARDAANTLALRNGANAQTFNLYNTYTDASNYERCVLSTPSDSSSNQYISISPESAGTGSGNIGLVIGSLGTGALCRNLPDGTIVGGNARGAEAVDLQSSRLSADEVVSGYASFAAGRRNKVTTQDAFAIGRSNIVGGGYGAIGTSNNVNLGLAVGDSCISSERGLALVQNGVCDKQSQVAFGGWVFSASNGIRQHSFILLSATTSDAVPTETFLSGLTSGKRAIIPANTTWLVEVDMLARSASGTDNACFKRRCIIKRDGSNNTSLVGSVETIGTDITSAGATSWAVTITADDTNESLKVEVTGGAATNIRWLSRVALVEIGYS